MPFVKRLSHHDQAMGQVPVCDDLFPHLSRQALETEPWSAGRRSRPPAPVPNHVPNASHSVPGKENTFAWIGTDLKGGFLAELLQEQLN